MSELTPYPFGALVRRMFRELDARDSIFDLPRSKWFLGAPGKDLSVRFHGHRAASPLGPAAGPQSQLAQNIVLSWLVGGRVMELKTVQIMDELEIPRPCIDMQTVGYNVEWSQELRLPQSLGEYVKAAMLIEMLRASGRVPLVEGFEGVLYDMSVGYDLKGIQSEPVQAFIHGMQDCTELVEQFRAEIPDDYADLRGLGFPTRLSDTLTLSTFHGCPPDEIEGIVDHLLRHNHLNCIVKLNPMLLGPSECRRLLNDVMGYTDVSVPDTAFERDASWDQVVAFLERLDATAQGLGLGLGIKLTNTLIVENHRSFFPATEKEMYLSGAPLHVLAMNLVKRFREHFGDRFPISFSAGIERANFADAAALGLVPITVCSDLLKPGGYARATKYWDPLLKRMDTLGADDLETYVIVAYGHAGAALEDAAPPADVKARCQAALAAGTSLRDAAGPDVFAVWVSAAKVRNALDYVPRATADPRYAKAKNSKVPKKIGSVLELFDCITCDKCIPVCPNDANFRLHLPPTALPIAKLRRSADRWEHVATGELVLDQKHQIANYADFCNECGNCDIFCPEDGGPYVLKPRFFGQLADFESLTHYDGFHVSGGTIRGRFTGVDYRVEQDGETITYAGPGFRLVFEDDPAQAPVDAVADGAVIDLTYLHILRAVRDAVASEGAVNYVSCRG